MKNPSLNTVATGFSFPKTSILIMVGRTARTYRTMQQIQLSLEQQASIEVFRLQVNKMSCEETKEHLVALYKQSIYQQVTYIKAIGEKWGLKPTNQENI